MDCLKQKCGHNTNIFRCSNIQLFSSKCRKSFFGFYFVVNYTFDYMTLFHLYLAWKKESHPFQQNSEWMNFVKTIN